MALLVTASINLNKIDKTKIKTHDKNGNPYKDGAKYYDIAISVNDEIDQYGKNVQLYDSQTKDQRLAKEKRNFIGNGQVSWRSDGEKKQSREESTNAKIEQPEQPSAASDDLPF